MEISQDIIETRKLTPRYHGFTCPECGSHMFGTIMKPDGTKIGLCHENNYSGNGCSFTWNRKDPDMESKVMYKQTRAEWLAGFDLQNESSKTA